jgi:hypothetical protein
MSDQQFALPADPSPLALARYWRASRPGRGLYIARASLRGHVGLQSVQIGLLRGRLVHARATLESDRVGALMLFVLTRVLGGLFCGRDLHIGSWHEIRKGLGFGYRIIALRGPGRDVGDNLAVMVAGGIAHEADRFD